MATDPLSLLVTGWLASAIVMALLWIVDCRLRNASIADVGWCYGLALVVLWYASSVSGEPARRWLVAVMVFCYAVRLGTHVLVDRVWNKTEDGRYRSLRLRWGKQASTRMFGYFHLQAAAIALFSLPPLVVMQNPHPPFHFWDLAGFLLWSVAVIGETVADRQLAAFRGKAWNKDRVCRIGLWRLLPPPQLLLRMAALVELCADGIGHPDGKLGPDAYRSGCYGRGIVEDYRHFLDRGPVHGDAWRGVRHVPAYDERIHSLVSAAAVTVTACRQVPPVECGRFGPQGCRNIE